MRWNKYEVSLAQIRRPSSEIKFRVVELKTPRFSTGIGSNLYADDRVEYFFVFLVAAIISGIRRMNEVNERRTQLVLGWVIVFGRVYHLGV